MAATSAVTTASRGVLARDRLLPAAGALAALLPEGGLVRGRVVACTGPAAGSLALAATADAVAAGSWLAVVAVDWLGVEAAIELGVAAERLVRVDIPDQDRARWADVVAAALDGFEIVVTQPPARVPAASWRRLHARVQAKSALLLVVGDRSAGVGDVVLRTTQPRWEWAGRARAHLRARRVQVEVTGRRSPRPTRAVLWLPAPGGGVRSDTARPESPAEVVADRAWRTAG